MATAQTVTLVVVVITAGTVVASAAPRVAEMVVLPRPMPAGAAVVVAAASTAVAGVAAVPSKVAEGQPAVARRMQPA